MSTPLILILPFFQGEDSNKKDEESDQEKIKLLTKENMELQRLYHLLQRQTEEQQTDPQRNAMVRAFKENRSYKNYVWNIAAPFPF